MHHTRNLKEPEVKNAYTPLNSRVCEGDKGMSRPRRIQDFILQRKISKITL